MKAPVDGLDSFSYSRPGQPIKLQGPFRGEIVNRVDPEKLGRCRIRTYNWHDGISDDEIPWAWPMFMGAGHSKSGTFHVPPVGSTVYVFLEYGDPDHMLWIGGYWGKPEGQSEVPNKCHDQDGNPDNFIWETPKGHYIELDERQGVEKIRIKTKKGHQVILDETEESEERSDTDNPDSIPFKQKGIHIITAGGHEFHMQDETDRSGKHTGIEALTKSGHVIRMKDSEDSDGKIKGIRIQDAKGNYIQMDDTQDLLDIFWAGNKREQITGNVNLTVGGNRTETIAGNHTEGVGGNTTVSTAGKVDESAGGDFEVSAGGNLVGDSGGNTEFTAGGDFMGIADGSHISSGESISHG